MASFNLGPHPRMLNILEQHDLKEKIPLPEFIEALKHYENGYRWEDLAPRGVDVVVWNELHLAYQYDEGEINGWKAAQDNGRAEHYGRGGELSRDSRDRISDTLGEFYD